MASTAMAMATAVRLGRVGRVGHCSPTSALGGLRIRSSLSSSSLLLHSFSSSSTSSLDSHSQPPPSFTYIPPSKQPEKKKPYFVTTPIFYVNAVPHIGHLHSDLVADVLARYHAWRYRGWSPTSLSPSEDKVQPIFSTGTDEHGLKIQKAAEKAKETPKALCDRISLRFRDLASAANLSHTHFIRTTEPQHAEAVREIWRRLQEGGYIYKGEHSGWYSVSDEAFYTDQQVHERISKTGEKYMEAIETGQRVEWCSEENYKFRLSLFRDALLTWHKSPQPLPSSLSNDTLDRFKTPLQPPSQHSALIAELESGPLADLSVSRPRKRLEWGIPVPGDEEEHTIYVWIDALVNYLTVTGFPWERSSSGAEVGSKSGGQEWEGSAWPADVHVVGKDIVRFHAIYWPAMLMAANLPLPRHIVAHAHWTMNKSKMSKSLGNVVDPFEALQKFRPPSKSSSSSSLATDGGSSDSGSVDVLRWYLMRIGGNLATDSNYSESILRQYHRKYLQGQIGNLVSRALSPKVLQRLADGPQEREEGKEVVEVRAPRPDPVHPDDEGLERQLEQLAETFDMHIQRFELSKALQVVHDAVAVANEHLSRLQPWLTESQLPTIQRAVYYSTETLRLTALLFGSSVMPERMQVLLNELGLGEKEGEEEERTWEAARKLREVVCLKFRTDEMKIAPLFPALAPPPSGDGGGKGKGTSKGKGQGKRKEVKTKENADVPSV
ncbi:hypothetical protein A4X13_0g6108 [Tilletia indica]|uniref:methionine--tRNA ligase n=1 Tax=Tilletia indica TaxID=43049 RepID=A0A177T9G0_9BASI|nr:hypothetical protein A4X13_0g6108 [Tilletia indica]